MIGLIGKLYQRIPRTHDVVSKLFNDIRVCMYIVMLIVYIYESKIG